jgi:hypothetical protein
MPVPAVLPIGLTDEFATDVSRQAMWHAFLKKNEITITPLSEVVAKPPMATQTPPPLATSNSPTLMSA